VRPRAGEPVRESGDSLGVPATVTHSEGSSDRLRILVQDGVYDTFTKRLVETARAIKVADGFEPGAVIAPLIDMKAVEKVEAHITDI
jgi:Aldehyde dehydrogenase family